MKPKEFVNKYQIILGLSAILVVMIVVKLTYKYEPMMETKNLVTPTVTPTVTTTTTGENYPLWPYIPYEEETFKIEKYSQPLTIVVKLKKGEKGAAYEKVIKWMEGLKIKLPAHEIVWE